MIRAYPVILTQVEDCVLVEVPDLEVLTQGKEPVNQMENHSI